jgi:putative salt-induced outer membrane protein YdiY
MCLSGINHAIADEVVLENGDRLTGRIVEVKDGILTLETSYSEPIKLKFEAVREMRSDEPVEAHLADGEILKGKISTVDNNRLEVKASPERDSTVIGMESIVAVNPPPKPPVTWQGNVTLGGNWQDGNTDNQSLTFGARAQRRGEKDRITMSFLYNRGETDGIKTSDNLFGNLKYDYFLSKAWYLYLNIDLLSDEFRDINLRTVVGPGVGYQVWEDDKKSLGLEAGVSYFSEDRDVGIDDDWITARLAADFMYKLFDRIVFTDVFTIYPRLDSTGGYQLRNMAALTTDIGASWSFVLSNIFERDSDPAPGVESNDITWILGLQYSF